MGLTPLAYEFPGIVHKPSASPSTGPNMYVLHELFVGQQKMKVMAEGVLGDEDGHQQEQGQTEGQTTVFLTT